jgi:hypothetical protein
MSKPASCAGCWWVDTGLCNIKIKAGNVCPYYKPEQKEKWDTTPPSQSKPHKQS